jgi:hypothetical protein
MEVPDAAAIADDALLKVHESRDSLIARSGQAETHKPQAWQFCALTANAWRLPWTQALSRAPGRRARLSLSLSRRISKTLYGHTCTQSSFPSQRERSITGTNLPASCLQSGTVEVSMRSSGIPVSNIRAVLKFRSQRLNRLILGRQVQAPGCTAIS